MVILLVLVALFVSTGINAADVNQHKRQRLGAYNNYVRKVNEGRKNNNWFRCNADKTCFSVDEDEYTKARILLVDGISDVDLETENLLIRMVEGVASDLGKKTPMNKGRQEDLVANLMAWVELHYQFEKKMADTALDDLTQERRNAERVIIPGTNFAVVNSVGHSYREMVQIKQLQRLEEVKKKVDKISCVAFVQEFEEHKKRKLSPMVGSIFSLPLPKKRRFSPTNNSIL